MNAIDEFAVTMTLCFTPEHLGLERHYTSPPKNPQDFADFATWAVERYAPGRRKVESDDAQAAQSASFLRDFMDLSVGAQ
jgi:hypothetical protein